jgi:signal transduction histidine kinase/ligand-binding sensor domain-containing protein
MSKSTALLLGFLFAMLPGISYSQSSVQRSLRLKLLTIDDGLSQGFVHSILQDRRGFMWFGTNDGLNKFDGNRFKVYRHDPRNKASLADNYVLQLFEDQRGLLWISYNQGYLDVFDPETERVRHIEINIPNESQPLAFGKIFQVENGDIFLFNGRGYLKVEFNATRENFTEAEVKVSKLNDYFNKSGIAFADILSVYHAKDGRIFFTTMDSTFIAANADLSKSEHFIRYHNDYFIGHKSTNIPNHYIILFEDRIRKQLICVSSESLTFLDPESFRKNDSIRYDNDGPQLCNFACSDRRGRIWIGNTSRMMYYDPIKNEIARVASQDISISNDILLNTKNGVVDQGGVLWIGTAGYGVIKYNPAVDRFNHIRGNTEKSLSTYDLFESENGDLVFSGSQNLPLAYRRKTNQLLSFPDFLRVDWIKSELPTEVLKARGTIYCFGKFYFFKNEIHDNGSLYAFWTDSTRYYSRKISLQWQGNPISGHLFMDSSSRLWAVDNLESPSIGCYRFDPSNSFPDRRYEFPVRGSINSYRFVSSMVETPSGSIIFGTNKGVFILNPAFGSWKSFRHSSRDNSSLPVDMVFSLCKDPAKPDEYLWIGTNGGGLVKLNLNTMKGVTYNTRNGLPNDVIYGIVADKKGKLWLSTNQGICKFDPEQSDGVRVFTVNDGLQSNEFNRYSYLKFRSGEIAFGGINGLNIFDPEKIDENPYSPETFFTSLKIKNQEIKINEAGSHLKKLLYATDIIELNYDQNIITIEFSASDYSAPEKILYKYMLEGLENDWSPPTKRHEAYYTNLDPGEYTLRVKSTNSDGIWIGKEVSLKIIIHPPVWATWWAKLIYILIIIGLVYGTIRWRTILLKKRNLELELRVNQRTEALRETQEQLVQQEKLASLGQLTAGIAHEIKNPLNFVNNFAEVAAELVGEIESEKDEEEKAALLQELRNLLEKINHHGKRADRIVKSMLEHSRGGSNEKQATDLNSLCEEFMHLAYHGMRASNPGFNCTMEKNLDPTLPLVPVQTQDFGRVLINIISNAFHAVENLSERAPIVSISTQLSGNKAIITIHDNGSGIPDEIRKKIFEPFFTTKPTGKGTGLGLSISYDIIKAHGGELTVSSEENRFTEFRIQIPIQ